MVDLAFLKLNSHIENPFFVCSASLWSSDGKKEIDIIDNPNFSLTDANPAKYTKCLVGGTVVPSYNLGMLSGNEGVYFIFTDLSVRTEGWTWILFIGTYTLKFSLCNLLK